MKLFRKAAALLLAAVLCILTACGKEASAPDTKTAMGRYIEESWELPVDAAHIPVIVRRPDDSILAIMYSTGPDVYTTRAYTTLDGKAWEEDATPWLKSLLERGGSVRDLAYGKNGECYLTYDVMEGDDYFVRVAHVSPDGVFEDINGEWEKAMRKIDSIAFSAAAITAPEESAVDEDASNTIVLTEPEVSAAEEAAAENGQESAAEEGAENAETVVIDPASSFYPTGMAVGDDGDFYIGIHDNIARFSPDGKFKSMVAGSYYPEFVYYDGGLAVWSNGQVRGETNTFTLHDADSGEKTQELNLQALQNPGHGIKIATGPDGALYAANTSGIYRLVPQGSTWERMVDGDLSSLSIPSLSIDKFLPHGDNEFLTVAVEQNKPSLINYVYSASTSTRPNTELTVAALKNNNTLLQAAGEFRRLHPEVMVTVQTLLEEDGSATAADAIRVLNTQLLAGKGPDLLLLDGLPMDSYIEKGVLADMSDFLDPVVEGELLPNVAGAFADNGKLYAVPARFSMPTIWGVPEAVSAASSMDSLVKYAEDNIGKKLLYDMTMKSLFTFFSNTSASAWLDGAKLDEKAFTEYLELIKRLADTIPSDAQKEDDMNMSPGFTLTGIDTGGAMDLASGKVRLFSADLFGFTALMTPNGAISALHGVAVTPDTTSVEDSLIPSHFTLLPGQAENVFVPSCVMGINAAGGQQELAREFIKTVLSEAVQYSDLQDGFPVNKAAIERSITRKNEASWIVGWDDEVTGEYHMMQMGWPAPGVFRAVTNLFGELNTPYMPDETLMEMIMDESEGFFDGSRSAGETASAVSARLELYIAEQS